MQNVNWELKSALIERFGSQIEAAKQLGIRESKLSYIVRRHAAPSEQEQAALEKGLGRDVVRKLLR